MTHHSGRLLPRALFAAVTVAATAGCAYAQQPSTPTPAPATTVAPTPAAAAPVLKVGDQAPDFSLPGATRYGLLAQPVKLSDYRGQTVVLAFFFKARTKG